MKTIKDKDFRKYGIVIDDDVTEIVSYLINKSKMPEEKNIYVANDDELLSLKEVQLFKEKYYGLSEIQAGYCNGFNSKLNCLEFHGCLEINVAATDLVLLLATQDDIVNDKVDTKKVEAFYIKKNDAFIIYPGTLHFSPCKVNSDGFKCAVILTKGTNLDLPYTVNDNKLFKVNKWLYAHEESVQAKNGAYIGLEGENIEVKC